MIIDLSSNIQMVNHVGCNVSVNSIDDIMILAGCLNEWKTVLAKISEYQFCASGHNIKAINIIGARDKCSDASKLSVVGNEQRGGFSFT